MEAEKGNVAPLWSSLVAAVGGIAILALGWEVKQGSLLVSYWMIIFRCRKSHSFLYFIHFGGSVGRVTNMVSISPS